MTSRKVKEMKESNTPVIQPVYNRPHNLMRKMSVMKDHIDALKRMQDYYCPIFNQDPWVADRIKEAEAHYAALQAAFEEETEGLELIR